MSRKLLIFGNGIMAKMAHYYFLRDSKYQILGFTVSESYNNAEIFCGLPVTSFEEIENIFDPAEVSMFIAIGPSKVNAIRESYFFQAKKKGFSLASYISPHSVCSSEIGENCLISDQVIIHPFVKFGNNIFCWDAAFVAHDSVVGDHCYLAPGSVVSTFSELGHNSVLGTKAIVNTRITVAPRTFIGASCYISKNTKENGVYGERSSEFFGAVSERVSF